MSAIKEFFGDVEEILYPHATDDEVLAIADYYLCEKPQRMFDAMTPAMHALLKRFGKRLDGLLPTVHFICTIH